ncbi:MAG: PIG-L deacetylase family protein [Armatimonadota bacterium]
MNLRNFPRWRRPLASLLIIPVIAVSLITGLYYGNLHRLSAVDRINDLDALDIASQARALVFAPHCDDETLGVGGVIKSLSEAGTPVKTVFFTNGDGFRIAAQFHLKKLNLTSTDYISFGKARQAEAVTAASFLGQTKSAVGFLGFPDQGLLAMLVAPGTAPNPFRPSTTKSDTVPYTNATASGLPHVRESVISRVEQELEQFKPTDVYVTHPLDDHSDHAAAPVYVQMAIDRGVKRGAFPRPRIHWYLIHRGDWPLPQGDHPDRWLVPPTAIAESGKQWTSITLSQTAVTAKRTALYSYSSQINVMQRMLLSFLRRNEIVTRGDALETINLNAIEPVGDNVARFANPSADVARLDASINGDKLVVKTTMAGPCSPAIDAFVTVVTASASGSNANRVRLPRPQLLETQRDMTASIPLKTLGIDSSTLTISVGVSTYAAEGLLVDRSAFHFVELPESRITGSLFSEPQFSHNRQSAIR